MGQFFDQVFFNGDVEVMVWCGDLLVFGCGGYVYVQCVQDLFYVGIGDLDVQYMGDVCVVQGDGSGCWQVVGIDGFGYWCWCVVGQVQDQMGSVFDCCMW